MLMVLLCVCLEQQRAWILAFLDCSLMFLSAFKSNDLEFSRHIVVSSVERVTQRYTLLVTQQKLIGS